MKFLIALLLSSSTILHSATTLENVAAALVPGKWSAVTGSGLGPDLYTSGPVMDIIWAFGSQCHWDSRTKQLLYLGSPHGAPANFIVYTDSTNSWRLENTCRHPQTSTNRFGHSYDLRTFDTHNYKYWIQTYVGPYYLFTYDPLLRTWDSVSPIGTFDNSNYNSIDYFPDIRKIVAYSGKDGTIRVYDPGTNTWTNTGRVAAANGYEVVAEYNPKHRCMILGGGDRALGSLYALDTNLNLRTLTASPVRVGAGSAELTCDPASGDILLFSGVTVRAYNIETNTWKTVPVNPPGLSTITVTAATSVVGTIYEYNCHVMLNTSNYSMLIYKHSADSQTVSEKNTTHHKSAKTISASPNPFSSVVHFDISSKIGGKITIFDISGREVKSVAIDGGNSLWDGHDNNSKKATPGTYIANYTDNMGNREVCRIMLTK